MKYLGIIFLIVMPVSIFSQSQTEAFLNLVGKEAVEEALWGAPRYAKYETESFDKYNQVVQQVIANEKKLSDNYYFFYNATVLDFFVLQEAYKALNYLLNGIKWENFEYIRPKTLLYKPLNSLDEYFAFVDTQADKTDHNPAIRDILMSTNISFPGNLEHQESTFFYFTQPLTQIPAPEYERQYEGFLRSAIRELVPADEVSDKIIKQVIDELNKVRELLKPIKSGQLLQIAIPKDLVNTYAYLSSDYGYPYGRTDLEEELVEVLPNLWSADKKRFENISDVLDIYRTTPEKIGEDIIQELQARIVLSEGLFGSPKTGVKIFKYSMIPSNVERNVKDKIATIMQRLTNTVIQARMKKLTLK